MSKGTGRILLLTAFPVAVVMTGLLWLDHNFGTAPNTNDSSEPLGRFEVLETFKVWDSPRNIAEGKVVRDRRLTDTCYLIVDNGKGGMMIETPCPTEDTNRSVSNVKADG